MVPEVYLQMANAHQHLQNIALLSEPRMSRRNSVGFVIGSADIWKSITVCRPRPTERASRLLGARGCRLCGARPVCRSIALEQCSKVCTCSKPIPSYLIPNWTGWIIIWNDNTLLYTTYIFLVYVNV